MKTICFVDGFNLYHSLDTNPLFHKYKWLDLRKLAEDLIGGAANQVLYFSAYCNWDKHKEQRHKVYVDALTSRGVHIVLGKFIPVTNKFKKHAMPITDMAPYVLEDSCIPDMIEYRTHEEKRTDVNIATKILDYAYQNYYDHAYVITADNDIAPAIETVTKRFPAKHFTLVVPMNKRAPKDLLSACSGSPILLTEQHLINAQLPNPVIAGSLSINKPTLWS